MMKNKRNRGFTLVEVILVAALVAVATLLMYSFIGQGFSLYGAEAESADDQMNMRQAMSDITNIVRLTDPSAISVSNGVLTVDDRKYKLENGSILRNGGAIANRISVFDVSISSNILVIRIVNSNGTEIKSSLSLIKG
jgi:prepilin-type N-terminal cleavage/methylation domain-containing protein